MNSNRWHKNKMMTVLQSQALVLAMAALLGYVGLLLGGQMWALMVVVAVIFIYHINPSISPAIILRMHRARYLDRYQAPRLYDLVDTLAERAGLRHTPSVYLLPDSHMNAFTVGSDSQAAIAVSEPLLQILDPRERAAVLAHEISHIQNQDIRVMGFAALVNRLTATLSLFGQILLFLNLPLVLAGKFSFSWTAILLLIFAPTLSTLLQLALSRAREYNADLGAVKLTADPLALASALKKIGGFQRNFLPQMLFPMGRRRAESSVVRTHPPTRERIRRLFEMRDSDALSRRQRIFPVNLHNQQRVRSLEAWLPRRQFYPR